jgi:hypothetical protein
MVMHACADRCWTKPETYVSRGFVSCQPIDRNKAIT